MEFDSGNRNQALSRPTTTRECYTTVMTEEGRRRTNTTPNCKQIHTLPGMPPHDQLLEFHMVSLAIKAIIRSLQTLAEERLRVLALCGPANVT